MSDRADMLQKPSLLHRVVDSIRRFFRQRHLGLL